MKPGGGRGKGSAFERQIAKVFEKWARESGVKVHIKRTPLSGGWGNKAEFSTQGDLVCSNKKFPFSVECKKQEKWYLEQILYNEKCKVFSWWDQCRRETSKKKYPLLVFSKNHFPVLVMFKAKDYKLFKGRSLKKAKLFKIKTKKTGLCYVMMLKDFLKRVSFPT